MRGSAMQEGAQIASVDCESEKSHFAEICGLTVREVHGVRPQGGPADDFTTFCLPDGLGYLVACLVEVSRGMSWQRKRARAFERTSSW